MPKQTKLALIVAKPGHLWNGVQSLLRTMPQIEIIAELRDPAVLLKMGVEMQPDLVVLEASLIDEEIRAVMNKIKEDWLQTQCVVLVEDSQQRQYAQDAGADHVLIKGFSASKLVAIFEELLSKRENGSQIESDSQDES